MTRSALTPLVTVLMLVAVCPAHAAAQALLVQVDNDARIPAEAVARMEQVAAASFLRIGVQVIWEHGEAPLDDARGLRVHLRLLSRANAERKIAKERIGDAVLGQTNRQGRRVYIFFGRIVDESFKYSREYTQILGLVVAHELGHVVLPAGSHADSGVMKGRARLRGRIPREFTPEEGEAIRALLQESPTAPLAGNRIRTSNAAIAALLEQVVKLSPTFQGLVDTINASDGIVYVERGECKSAVRSCLLMSVVIAGPLRALNVRLDLQRPDDQLMGSIAHELRHAVEVLSDPSVRSDVGVENFYKVIGKRIGDRVETQAAIDAGEAVRAEVRNALKLDTRSPE
jgi:hypothetical protein